MKCWGSLLSLKVSDVYLHFVFVYRTHAYNARAIQVGHIPNGVLGQPVEFESK